MSGSANSAHSTTRAPASARSTNSVTDDRRTLTTNYNVLDNSTKAEELWVRSGFVWTPSTDLTVKNQSYYYQARTPLARQRDLCVQQHNEHDRSRPLLRRPQPTSRRQHTTWSGTPRLFGMENRVAVRAPVEPQLARIQQHAGGFPAGHRRRLQSDRRHLWRCSSLTSSASGSTRSRCRSRTGSKRDELADAHRRPALRRISSSAATASTSTARHPAAGRHFARRRGIRSPTAPA